MVASSHLTFHYDDVIMIAMASQITSLTNVYSTVYSGADQSKHQSSASLAFVWGIHPHKWPVTRKMFPFDDIIVWHYWGYWETTGTSHWVHRKVVHRSMDDDPNQQMILRNWAIYSKRGLIWLFANLFVYYGRRYMQIVYYRVHIGS